MMSRYHNLDAIEKLWSSALFKDAYPECHTSDDEILKASLLMHSALRLFKGLRDQELSISAQLKSLTEKWQIEKAALQEELLHLRNELNEAGVKARKFQQEAKVASTKSERLQSKISAEVEARLHAMFNNCLQQNKAATVLDMMTQFCHDTQLPEKDFPAQAKLSLNNKKVDSGSPDLIQPTPEDKEKKKGFTKKKKERKSEKGMSSVPKQINRTFEQIPLSPNEIANTPVSFHKRDNSKRQEKLSKLFKDEPEESDNLLKNEIFAKDTQDLEENLTPKLVLYPNVCIPETVNPEIMEEEKGSPDTTDKENRRGLSESHDHLSRKIANLSTDSYFPTTPDKPIKPRSGSPILGNSGSKKSNSRVQFSPAMETSSVYALSKKSLEVQSKKSSQNKSGLKPAICDFGYRLTENRKIKRSVQPNLSYFVHNQSNPNRSKLSLRKDVSKMDEFNGGQRSSVDLALAVSQLSEKLQCEIALKNSMEDKSHNSAAEDSDTTLFEPNSPLREGDEVGMGTDSFNQQTKIKPSSNPPSIGASSETFFEPGFASTAKEDVFLMREPNSVGEDLSDNSKLNDLVSEINKGLDDTAPYPPETSYDRLPKRSTSPDYAYVGGPVRKKSDRRNLKGVECLKCGEFFDAAFDNPNQKLSVVNDCSRHRSKHGLRSRSPKGYWDMGMPPTQVIRERQGLPTS